MSGYLFKKKTSYEMRISDWSSDVCSSDLTVKNAVQYISHFETAVAAAASERGFDGVVCGHIHRAEMRMIENVLYCNDGDWVESCTALVENADGTLEIIHWADPAHAAETADRKSTRLNSSH